jgi:hypothetical protein
MSSNNIISIGSGLRQGACDDDLLRNCTGTENKENYYLLFLRLIQLNDFNVYKVSRLGPLSPQPWNPRGVSCGKCTAVVR